MPPIDSFNAAFNIFLNTGRFELSDSSLSLKQLQTIHAHLTKYPIPLGRTTSFYEIHLNKVEFIPFHIEELIEPKGSEDTILSGDLAEEELPASLKGRPEFNAEDKTLRILNYLERAEHFQKVDYEYAVEAIEKTLLSLFEATKWQVIKLEDVRIAEKKDENKPLNFQFMYALYNALSTYTDQIKELSLKKVDLFNKDGLVNLLKKASKLEILRLEDIQQEKNIFPSLNAPNVLLDHLCEALAYHSTLRQLDLGATTFSEEGYFKLFTLLDNNYRLDKIFLKKPSILSNLLRLHEELMARINERSRKTGLERFKEKQLTLNNLFKLAELGLESDKFNFIKLTINHADTERLAITQPNFVSETYLHKLPEGFRRFPEYTQQCWPMHLDVCQRLENQTTIGANLLEKAYQLRKPQYIRLLLAAGADLLEQLPGKSSLVERIFADKEEKIYKQTILNHVKRDLSVFVPFISRLLPSYKKIDGGLRNIKLQLDQFITTLLELDQLPFLLKLFKGIGLQTKKENWEKDFRLVIQAAQAGTNKNPVTHSALSDFEQTLEILHREVEKAKKQWFIGYQFNRKLQESLKQLLTSTREYQSKLFREWENGQSGASLEQANIVELQQKLIKSEEEKNEIIRKFEERERVIKAEMEAKHAQDLSDLETRMKTEMEKQNMQNYSDLEARFEAKLNKLFSRSTQQQEAFTTDAKTSENSTRFFMKP